MNKLHDAIDIVIPVYNGYDDIQLCMDSIRRHTDLKKHYVILINDCSPDERIVPYLNSQAEDHIIVIHNEKNMGFSANVNKGMLFSDRDVILLNSDTIVTERWVDKIQACAYAETSIGTVTPLSNSATLCSVPVFCQDNPIPEGFDVDSYGALIEKCSLKRYPEITVAVGFCMFVKQNVIEEVGLFDAATFERGYGEENDFCNRANQLGYKHVMCDDTFIYHKGTASFDTEEKLKLCQAHDAILQERYSAQMKRNHLYCMENPDQEIRDNIHAYAKLYNGKKNILYFTHLDFQEDAYNCTGGIQLHVKDMVNQLVPQYNVFVVARDKNFLRVTGYTEKDCVKMKYEISDSPLYPVFRDENMANILRKIFVTFDIDAVHVHHTQDLSLEVYYVAHEYRIPLYATIHDYYYVCPTIKLLTNSNDYCPVSGGEEQNMCADCLNKQCNIAYQTPNYIEKWRKENHAALSLCDKLIFPSKAAQKEFLRYFADFSDRSMVIEHGSDVVSYECKYVSAPTNIVTAPKAKVHFDLLLGIEKGLNSIKGWAYLPGVDNQDVDVILGIKDCHGKQVYVQTVKEARPDVASACGSLEAVWSGFSIASFASELSKGKCDVSLYLKHGDTHYTDGKVYRTTFRGKIEKKNRLNVGFLGGMVPAKGSILAKEMILSDTEHFNWFVFGAVGDKALAGVQQSNLYFGDSYKKENIVQILTDNEIDVICILSSWAETFCYTVSESWMAEIPVLGFDIGAVGERIKEQKGGWLLPVGSSSEKVVEFLKYLQEHPEEIEEKKKIIRNIPKKTVSEMTDEYRKVYQSLPAQKAFKNAEADRNFIFQGLALADENIGGNGYYGKLNRLQRENNLLKNTLEMTKGTLSYRLAQKIANAKIPFREQIQKRLRR